jgi:hypothetical protein
VHGALLRVLKATFVLLELEKRRGTFICKTPIAQNEGEACSLSHLIKPFDDYNKKN